MKIKLKVEIEISTEVTEAVTIINGQVMTNKRKEESTTVYN
jgi:hypothetical protein